MRLKTAFGAIAMTSVLLTTSFAAVPLVISHQGRLLDAADHPVTGSVSITFSLYEVPTGGTALASETQVVVVNNGLFSVQLSSLVGSTGLPNVSELWLGRKVGADAELMPRLRVGSVPYALTSSRVQGDITTTPGSMAIGDLTGDGRADIVCASDESSLFLKNTNTPGNADNVVELASDNTGARGILTGMSGSTTGTIRMQASPDSAVSVLESDVDGDGHAQTTFKAIARGGNGAYTVSWDFDDDGVADNVVENSSDAAGARSILSGHMGSTTGTIRMQASPDSISESSEVTDGSTSVITNMRSRLDNLEAKLQLFGLLARSTVTQTCDPSGASSILSGHQGSTTGTIRMQATPDSTVSDLDNDSDDDGLPEAHMKTFVEQAIASQQASLDANSDGVPEYGIDEDCDGTAEFARLKMFVDKNGDGTIDGSEELKSSATGVSHALLWDAASPGSADMQITMDCDDTDARTLLSGRNGSTTGTIRMAASPDLGYQVISGDWDGDNVDDMAISSTCDPSSARIRIMSNADQNLRGSHELSSSPTGVLHSMTWDSNADGIVDVAKGEVCDDGGSSEEFTAGVAIPKFIQISARESGPMPGGTSDVSMVMGLGTDSLVELGADDTGTSLSMKDKSGTYTFELVVTDATGLVSMTNGSGATSLQLDAEGRIGLGGAADGSDPIHHSSGAHLSAAGDWVNASDKNAKENFTKVDGAEILEKIENLPITEWNYKTQGDDVRHIGPTAQDFKSTFGVGDNDKSISTIDPSGIALAAIKELSLQLKEKDKQIEELRSEMAKLRKEVSEKK